MVKIQDIPIIGRLFEKEQPRSRTYLGLSSIRRKAHLFYYPVRALFRAVARTQHAEIKAIGLENIPADGPVMLVGNHPNSLLDFFNVLNVVRHPVATAAKDTITGVPLLGYILKNYALMVPLARKQDQDLSGVSEAERVKANQEAVREAVEMLAHGRIFNIFGEGKSTDSRKLNKIKLGFMAIAIQAEKEFNFNLNLRIVPYGFYYDRINKFQSSVAIIFGKPVILKNLIERPSNALALNQKDWQTFEKKLMMAGKDRIKNDIEDLIISISDASRISLIDDCVALYALSPVKYMGPFNNIREKYRMSKEIADAILAGGKTEDGPARLNELNRLIKEYRARLKESGLPDALVRRETSLTSWGHHLLALAQGILMLPLSLYGYAFNFLPRQIGRFMRFYIIEIKKKEKVDGDEKAIIAAFATVLITYPIAGLAIGYAAYHGMLAHPLPDSFSGIPPGFLSCLTGIFSIYLMARLWRTSLYYGRKLKSVLLFLKDQLLEFIMARKIKDLRRQRYHLIDVIDFIITDYSP